MAEEFRLEASVIDKFSKPLKDLRDRLRDTKTPDSIKGMPAEFTKIENAVKSATRSIQSGLGQAMSGLGVSGLAATASVAGVIAAVKGFSGATIELKQFERETGITIATLKAMKHAASSFGVNEDNVAAALKRMTENLRDIQAHRPGSIFDELVRVDPQLMTALAGKSADEALEIIERQFAEMSKTLKGRQQAGLLAERIFGDSEMARYALRGIEPLKEALRKFYKESGPTEQDERAAVAFAQTIEQLQTSFSRLTKVVGTEAAPALTAVMEAVAKFVEANKGQIGSAIKDALNEAGEALKGVDWKAAGEDLTAVGAALKAIANTIREIPGFDGWQKGSNRSADGKDHRSWSEVFGDASRDADAVTQRYWDWLKKGTNKGLQLFQQQSYGGSSLSGGLLHQASFGGGVGSGAIGGFSLFDTIAGGTKAGLIAAFRELRGEQDFDKAGSGSGGGFTNASWGGSGSAATAAVRRAGNRGGRGGSGGAGFRPDGLMPSASGAGNLTKLIDEEAKRAGIDPRILEGIRAGESHRDNHFDIGDVNDGGAYGPFQFNMGKGRFGDQFFKATGKDPSNPKNIPAMTRYMAQFIARQLKRNPNYATGGDSSELHRVWHGFHGHRNADPRWGDSGYVPDAAAAAADASRRSAEAAKGGAYVPRHDGTGVPVPPQRPSLYFDENGNPRRKRDREPAELNVSIRHDGRITTKADTGDHFKRINIDTGRTRMWDA